MIMVITRDHHWLFFLVDRTRLWTGHEPDQPSSPDPAGQKGEGARVPAALRERDAPTSGVHHAGTFLVTEYATTRKDIPNHMMSCKY